MNILYVFAMLEFVLFSSSMYRLLAGGFGGASIYTPHIALISGLACVLFLVAAEAQKK